MLLDPTFLYDEHVYEQIQNTQTLQEEAYVIYWSEEMILWTFPEDFLDLKLEKKPYLLNDK